MMEPFSGVVFGQKSAGAIGVEAAVTDNTGYWPEHKVCLSREERRKLVPHVDVNACLTEGGRQYTAENMHDQIYCPHDAKEAVEDAKSIQKQKNSS